MATKKKVTRKAPGRKAGGNKTGGRKRGTPNKKTLEVIERLNEMGCDPIAGMVDLARGDADCLCCEKGRVTVPQYYRMIRKAMPDAPEGETQAEQADVILTCPNCGGRGKEPIDAALSGNMYKELAQYVAPKRKAIEHTGALDLEHSDINISINGKSSKD